MYIRPYEQEGSGLGDIFRSFFSRRNPIFTNVGKFVKDTAVSAGKSLYKTGLKTGTNILGDLAAGKNLKETVDTRVGEAGQEIQDKVVEKIKKMRGKGRPRRRKTTGVRRRRVVSHRPAVRRRRRKGVSAATTAALIGGGRRRRRRTTTKRRAQRGRRRKTLF